MLTAFPTVIAGIDSGLMVVYWAAAARAWLRPGESGTATLKLIVAMARPASMAVVRTFLVLPKVPRGGAAARGRGTLSSSGLVVMVGWVRLMLTLLSGDPG